MDESPDKLEAADADLEDQLRATPLRRPSAMLEARVRQTIRRHRAGVRKQRLAWGLAATVVIAAGIALTHYLYQNTRLPPGRAPTARLYVTDGSIAPAGVRAGWLTLMNATLVDQPKPVTYLGVSLDLPGDPLRAQLQLQDNVGLLVTWIDEQGPAKDALAKHDVIIRLDDQIIINSEQFQALVRMHKPGDVLDIRLVRNAKPIQVSVKLSEKSVAATGFANWSNDKLVTATIDGAAPIYIFSNIAGQGVTPPATQPVNAITVSKWIEGKLQDVKPDAPPDRATIARRLYLDVTGLPPSEAQIRAFVDDKSADAYEKLVRELLNNRPVVIQPQQGIVVEDPNQPKEERPK